jgi:hypothetical protein
MAKKSTRTIIELFNSKTKELEVKCRWESPKTVIILASINDQNNTYPFNELSNIKDQSTLLNFFQFYQQYNGFNFEVKTKKGQFENPIFKLLSEEEIPAWTAHFQPGGKFAYAIDFNKSKSLYRSNHKWIIIATIFTGYSALAMFLEGENCGKIFLIVPEPEFNILKPIARNFTHLLERISNDPAAFFKLVRAPIVIRGLAHYASRYIER